jgi:hypothetical protein
MRVAVILGIASSCSIFAVLASSQSEVAVGSEPSPLEAFAEQSEALTAWSSEVGRLDYDDTRAVVTALVLEDGGRPARRMRGVKIDLSTGDAHDRIYLDDEATSRTISALDEIAEAAARSSRVRNGCMGAREFWPLYNWPWNKFHELNADFCGGSEAKALVLYGRGKATRFQFPGETPSGVARILAEARDQLKQH